MLDPTLPEKQRARRRLIGAVALVLAAVIVLPMVLDSHPKPITDDIAISIPQSDDAHSAATAADNSTDPTQAASAATSGNVPLVATGGVGASAAALAGTDTAPAAPVAGSTVTRAAVPNTRRAPSAAVAKAPATAPVAQVAKATHAGTLNTDASNDSADAAAPGSRFIVQLGSFSSDAPARDWTAKLKALGVPAYVQHVKQSDGSDRVLLRAGPFADRAAAEAAVRKVRTAGLAPQQG